MIFPGNSDLRLRKVWKLDAFYGVEDNLNDVFPVPTSAFTMVIYLGCDLGTALRLIYINYLGCNKSADPFQGLGELVT